MLRYLVGCRINRDISRLQFFSIEALQANLTQCMSDQCLPCPRCFRVRDDRSLNLVHAQRNLCSFPSRPNQALNVWDHVHFHGHRAPLIPVFTKCKTRLAIRISWTQECSSSRVFH